MEQREGYVHPEFLGYEKALYGLKQAPRAWTHRISRVLQSIGFVINNANYFMYVKKTDTSLVIIVIYIDDLIIIGDDKVQIANVKKVLGTKFDMKDLGELMYFLGIEVIRTSQGIWLLQRKYVLDMLKKYHYDGM